MFCKRPVWTTSFVVSWTLLAFGTVLTHVALTVVVPAAKELPANIVKGFGEVFRFDYLEQDVHSVESAAAAALGYCNVSPATQCDVASLAIVTGSSDSSQEKAIIIQAFETSLDMILSVSSDPYFGTSALQDTAEHLQNMTAEVASIVSDSSCVTSAVKYCAIHQSAAAIVSKLAFVTAEIDKFEHSDVVKTFEEHADYLDYAHVLPYIMIVSMICFTVFWCLGGVCGCRKGSTFVGSCLLVPYALLWLVFFLIQSVIVVIGFARESIFEQVAIDSLNGAPTVWDVIEHLQKSFPTFWDIVFKDLARGLAMWFTAALVCEVFCLIIVAYACCVCCRTPYKEVASTSSCEGKPLGDAADE